MGFLDKIKRALNRGKLKAEQLERLRESISLVVADGEITDQRLEYIRGFYGQSELTPQEFNKLLTDIFTEVVWQAIADRRVDRGELVRLNHVAHRFGLPPEWIAWAQRQIQYYALFSLIESGARLPVAAPVNFVLQQNETCHLCIPAQMLEERVVDGMPYGGGGGSIHVTRANPYQTGQLHRQMVGELRIVPVSNGYFIITGKRIVFSGDLQSVSSDIKRLADLRLFSNGLSFTPAGRSKPVLLHFAVSEQVELCALIISRLINQ